ncbi:MCE family protein [Kibdelosporangium phytohabitans]|uniref:ABC transporter substrate-binding protein n=1 Tax=Kibdelosporangium phytohabitans TaxID=860235 RepID=A0A0N7F4X3_9PSEU|nr:MCE family protein [Kibdelosporangium phytohabitans]ALG12631.1 ABC transporter substrate-binding protein [Kibdelosporangium phytohabitans]MBE1464277.1 phospholipid/cholesterol/gamma-HCH transport system substrate-binding protein [Kibdelosporangium phytohabitans]
MKRLGLVLAAVLLAGCTEGGFGGLYNTPLPGGADVGDHPYQVTAQFGDVLDLVPQASVKVNDVAVGRVTKIELTPDNKMALVTLVVNGAVTLPANAGAELRQSSLLGEKFVQLRAPAGEQPQGQLTNGAVVPLSRTNRNPEVEEVLGALSMLLNGGGIEQLRTIVGELNSVLSGNEKQIRELLTNVRTLVSTLDGQRDSIVRAIDGLAKLSGTLVAQTGNLTNAVDNLSPGLKVLEQQRTQLTGMLTALDTLSDVAVDTVNRSKKDLVADLKLLEPTLRKLVETGDKLPVALEYLVTYPYPSYAVNAVRGDYFNVDAKLSLDFTEMINNLSDSGQTLLAPPGQPYGNNTVPLPLPIPVPIIPDLIPENGKPQPGQGLLGGLLGTLLGGG